MPTARWQALVDIVRGVEMGRPSLLQVAAHRAGDAIRAQVSGCGVPVSSGHATVWPPGYGFCILCG